MVVKSTTHGGIALAPILRLGAIPSETFHQHSGHQGDVTSILPYVLFRGRGHI
jgi:hypothetical protein